MILNLQKKPCTINCISGLRNEKEVSRLDFDKIVDELERWGYIEFFCCGECYQITSKGILFAEKNSIAPVELIKLNTKARTNILSECAKVYEKEGEFGYILF